MPVPALDRRPRFRARNASTVDACPAVIAAAALVTTAQYEPPPWLCVEKKRTSRRPSIATTSPTVLDSMS
jgi:hypothetical protein